MLPISRRQENARYSRRQLLRLLGLGAGLSLAAACGPGPATAPTAPAAGSGAAKPAAPAPAPAAPAVAPAAPAASPAAPAAPTAAPTAAAKPAAPLKRVTIGSAVEVPGWSPYAHSGSAYYSTWMNIYETLVRLDFDKENRGTIIPALAERWETPDGKTWTFHLRKGITFSDGSPFSATDVVYSYQRLMDDPDSLQSPQLKSYFGSMEAPDPHVFKLVLKSPNSAMLDELRKFVIMSKAQFDKLGGKEAADRQPLGTGPFLFKEWVQGQRFVLVRNDRYWGPKPEAEEVVIKVVGSDVNKITALNNGEVDIIDNISPHLISQIGGRARVLTVPGQRHLFIPMRPDTPPTDNKLVRQAIYHAIDRKTIAEKVLEGYATELKGPLASFCLGFDPSLPDFYPFNPTRAKELLAQAGASNLTFDFPVPTAQYVKAKEVGQVIVAMLKDVGLTANMKTPENATFNADVAAGKYGIYLTGRGNTLDPSAYLTQFFRTGASKRVGYTSPKVDEAIDAQQATTSLTERARLLSQAQRQLMEDAAAVFLYTYQDVYAVANTLEFQPWPNEYVHAFLIKSRGA